MKTKILLVDDEDRILDHMRRALETNYEVLTCMSEIEAFRVFEQNKPPLVILDLSLDQQDPSDLAGMRLLERILSYEPSTRVIMVTGDSRDANALRAVQLGASDYYVKPVRVDELKVIIERALHVQSLHHRLLQAGTAHNQGFNGIWGHSQSIQKVCQFIERVAPSDIPVLITGESGTGKQVVAREIHRCGPRKNKPFVAVNCGTISESSVDSDLFGHIKGSTAETGKPDIFGQAHKGTLFLDVIDALTPHLQAKLLHFLVDQKIDPISGCCPTGQDFRIVAATNRDLRKCVESRLFREDLYYRLRAATVTLPPLRDRKEDLIPLANYFLHKCCRENSRSAMELAPDASLALMNYPWPGNIRELENVIKQAVILSSNTLLLTAQDLGLAPDQVPIGSLKVAKQAIELDFVKSALSKNKGVVSRAARELGISRVNLYELMQKHNIRIQEFKARPQNTDQHLSHREAV